MANSCHPMDCIACLLRRFSHVRLWATLWTVAHQAPLSMGFSRQEYWSGLPCPSPEDVPNPGLELAGCLLTSLALAGRSITTSATWEAPWTAQPRLIQLYGACRIHTRHQRAGVPETHKPGRRCFRGSVPTLKRHHFVPVGRL